MGEYTFQIKTEDARRALRVLFEEDGVDPERVAGVLRELQDDIRNYLQALRQYGPSQDGGAGTRA